MSWSEAPRAALLCATLLCAALPGCGFTMRGTQQLPYPTIALNFPPNSPLGIELSRTIRTGTHTRVIDEPSKAAAIFDLIAEGQDRRTLTLNAQGRAVEYSLFYRLVFRLRDAQGHEVIEATELHAQRDISFNDSQRLSKESEEQLLYRDMRSDVVQQILRRLAAARPFVATN